MLALFAIATTAGAQQINAFNFPDENFRDWLLGQDYGQDGVLTPSEIVTVTQIDVSGKEIANLKGIEYFTALTTLYCYGNQIKGDKMQALVNSLPTVSGEKGAFRVINTKDTNEQNVITKSQVEIAKGKNWTVYDHNGGYPAEYEGSDDVPTAIDAPLNDNGGMTNGSWYTLDGVKLQGEPAKKGIYIRNGKKVVK